MSLSGNTQDQSMDKLHLLATMSDNNKIDHDKEEFQAILDGQEEIREELRRVEMDLQILFAA